MSTPRQQHLLLISAGEAAHGDQGAGRPDAQRLECLGRPFRRGRQIEDTVAARVAIDHADIDVLAARHVEEQTQPFAVLGQIGEAPVQGLLGPGDVHRLPAQKHLAADLGVGTVD